MKEKRKTIMEKRVNSRTGLTNRFLVKQESAKGNAIAIPGNIQPSLPKHQSVYSTNTERSRRSSKAKQGKIKPKIDRLHRSLLLTIPPKN